MSILFPHLEVTWFLIRYSLATPAICASIASKYRQLLMTTMEVLDTKVDWSMKLREAVTAFTHAILYYAIEPSTMFWITRASTNQAGKGFNDRQQPLAFQLQVVL